MNTSAKHAPVRIERQARTAGTSAMARAAAPETAAAARAASETAEGAMVVAVRVGAVVGGEVVVVVVVVRGMGSAAAMGAVRVATRAVSSLQTRGWPRA